MWWLQRSKKPRPSLAIGQFLLFPTDEYVHISAFMTKPISPDQLMAQVNKLLA